MAARWLMVADDLTGAADGAIAFAKRGIASAVTWGDRPDGAGGRPPVFSYNAASRGLPASEAATRHGDVIGRLLDPGCTLFKKMDSTLRGQPAAETAATIDALRRRYGSAFGILAPAFPAAGRTTVGGRIFVDGRPLEEAAVWQRDHSYANADLVEVLSTAGVRGATIPLSTIRGGPDGLRAAVAALAAGGEIVAVCDALIQDDLDRIAEACLPAGEGVFFIGSAGLAQALAAATPGERPGPLRLAPTANGSLVVVGSLADASRAAARVLASLQGVRNVPVDRAVLLDEGASLGRATLGRSVTDGHVAGDDVLVEILMSGDPDLSLGLRLADALAEALRPAASHLGGLAATGGATAAALLAQFGVTGIDLIDEIEPGVSLGLTRGAVSVPVVTKAGAFGDRGSLKRIAERLRLIKQGRTSG